MKDVKIQWHPGFVAAVDLELSANRKDLIYEQEYNLNVKPLEVDLLVIKKDRDIQLENEIGRLFRGYNIMEYKSPKDHLDIDTLYKAQAYASLYKSFGETVDGRKAEDITVSIVREGKPKGLLRYLKNHNIRVTNPYPGIYYVIDRFHFPTQIIVTRELKKENHAWLKALSDKMDKQSMQEFLEKIRSLSGKADQELADAVLEVSTRANQKTVEALRGDGNMCQALLEIMEPEINKIVEVRVESAVNSAVESAVNLAVESAMKSAEESAKEESIRTATKMVRSGKFSFEEILEYNPRLSLEEVRMIAAGVSQD